MVPPDKPPTATEWALTWAAASVVVLPFAVVAPYSTCESEGTAEFQVTRAVVSAAVTFVPLIQVDDPVEGANITSTQ